DRATKAQNATAAPIFPCRAYSSASSRMRGRFWRYSPDPNQIPWGARWYSARDRQGMKAGRWLKRGNRLSSQERAQRPAEQERGGRGEEGRGEVDGREDRGRVAAGFEDLRRGVERHDRLDARIGERTEAERPGREREHRIPA